MSAPHRSGRGEAVELRHLTALAALAGEGSLRRAARRLGASPATVRRAIAQLEAALSQQLVHLDRRGVRLTGAGRLLAEHAAAIDAAMREARDDLDALAAGETGALRIGALAGAPARLLCPLVEALRPRRPRLATQAVELAAEAPALEALAAGEVDVLIAELPLPPGPHDHCALLEDPYVLLVPSGSPLAERVVPVRADDLDGLELVAPGATATRERFLARLRDVGVTPRVAVLADEASTVHAIVRTGLAAAVLPRLAVDPAAPGTVAVDLGHLLPPSTVALVWRDGDGRVPAIVGAREAARALAADVRAARAGLDALAP